MTSLAAGILHVLKAADTIRVRVDVRVRVEVRVRPVGHDRGDSDTWYRALHSSVTIHDFVVDDLRLICFCQNRKQTKIKDRLIERNSRDSTERKFCLSRLVPIPVSPECTRDAGSDRRNRGRSGRRIPKSRVPGPYPVLNSYPPGHDSPGGQQPALLSSPVGVVSHGPGGFAWQPPPTQAAAAGQWALLLHCRGGLRYIRVQ